MRFDAEGLLARLAERERIKGHHSAEGRAIRTLSRALSGWLTSTLSTRDVLALCEQAMEDWLKIRLGVSEWSALNLPALIEKAEEAKLLMPREARSLKRMHGAQARARKSARATAAGKAGFSLELCIRPVETHW